MPRVVRRVIITATFDVRVVSDHLRIFEAGSRLFLAPAASAQDGAGKNQSDCG